MTATPEWEQDANAAAEDEPTCDECHRAIGDDDGCCRCGEREARDQRLAWRRGLGV